MKIWILSVLFIISCSVISKEKDMSKDYVIDFSKGTIRHKNSVSTLEMKDKINRCLTDDFTQPSGSIKMVHS